MSVIDDGVIQIAKWPGYQGEVDAHQVLSLVIHPTFCIHIFT